MLKVNCTKCTTSSKLLAPLLRTIRILIRSRCLQIIKLRRSICTYSFHSQFCGCNKVSRLCRDRYCTWFDTLHFSLTVYGSYSFITGSPCNHCIFRFNCSWRDLNTLSTIHTPFFWKCQSCGYDRIYHINRELF